MGFFGRKKGGEKQNINDQRSAPSPVPPTEETVIRIVGDTKHITVRKIGAGGREETTTTISKLTREELQQYAPIPPSAALNGFREHTVQPRGHQDIPVREQSPHIKQTPAPIIQDIPVGDQSLATIQVTRELVKGFIADIWNRGDIDLIAKICSPSLRFNGHVGFDKVGHDGFARMVKTVREALTDYHCEIHSMVVEKNKAFCRLKFTGKHTGTLLGYPPTGKTVQWVGASEFTCKDGKILKVWELGDVKSLEAQLSSQS